MLAQPQVGWKCAVCGERVAIGTPLSWRCPNSNENDTHHVLQIEQPIAPLRSTGDDNPYIAFRKYLAWDSFAAALGMSEDERIALIREADVAVERVAGTGFRFTPFARHDALSDALGFTAAGGVWVKDETDGVAGSHKSRHLFTEMLHLLAAEKTGTASWSTTDARPPLAIASCGNAAFAASTLAKAMSWPIEVFVPENAAAELTDLLLSVGANIVRSAFGK